MDTPGKTPTVSTTMRCPALASVGARAWSGETTSAPTQAKITTIHNSQALWTSIIWIPYNREK